MNLEHSTPELFAAMAKAQTSIENAAKNSANPHFKSRYADLAEVLNTVRPVFAECGLSVFQSTEFDGSSVRVTTCIAHAGGGYITSTASCVPAKTDAQGVGSATTYLRRYSLAAMAGVAQEDDDGNSAAHSQRPQSRAEHALAPPKPASQEQRDEIADLIRSTHTEQADFLRWLGAPSLDALTVDQFARAKRGLEAKMAKQAGEAA